MTLSEFKTLLATSSYPVAYRVFSSKSETTLPFIVYFETTSANFIADNKVYTRLQDVQVELYTKRKNETAETTLETIFNNNDFAWDKVESYLDDEKVNLVTYEVRILK